MKRDVIALWLAGSDPRVPLHAKLVTAMVAAYALSPIDLIPDFVPILGYLDDLLLVPLGVVLAVRLVPAYVMAELRLRAGEMAKRPVSRAGAAFVAALWVAAVALTGWIVWRTMN